jgi:SAM-dependent methyltransferase
MTIRPHIIALYEQMARDRLIWPGMAVCELGSEEVSAPGREELIERLFKTMKLEPPTGDRLRALSEGPGRQFYSALQCSYKCIDVDGRHGAIPIDLNFDSVPNSEKGQYDLVTNLGTAEHVFADANAFAVAHDLAKRGGLIVHTAPFLGQVDHGFRNYQPNLFYAVARANGYDFLGFWLKILPASLIPFEGRLLDVIAPRTDAELVALYRKPHEFAFNVPFQRQYESSIQHEAALRYRYIVDGEVVSGTLVMGTAVSRQSHLHQLPFRDMVRITAIEFVKRVKRRMRPRV